jgi:SAM-dependent methyltransferase
LPAGNVPKAGANAIDFGSNVRCVGGLTAVPATTDYDTIASLMLHYEADLRSVFAESARLLRPDGTLVFSTHHPVHDSVSILDPGYLNAELIEEEWGWLKEKMRHYRRPLRDLTDPLAGAGFVIERICEPAPSEELKLQDPKGYDRLCRLPAFIFVRARVR